MTVMEKSNQRKFSGRKCLDCEHFQQNLGEVHLLSRHRDRFKRKDAPAYAVMTMK